MRVPLVAAQGAGHRVLLMRTQGDAVGDAGRGQVGSVDVAGPHAVESAVVQGGEPLRAVGVLEHPLVPASRIALAFSMAAIVAFWSLTRLGLPDAVVSVGSPW